MQLETCNLDVLRERTEKDLSHDTLSAIRTVTSHMDTLPVGTFKYRLFKYPGDIDIFEQLESCCTLNIAKLNAARAIRDIIGNMVSINNLIFSEFKAGYDQRFNIYTGVINDDGTISDYYPPIIRRDIINLFESDLISYEEKDAFLAMVKDAPTLDDVILLNETLRNFWVVRWSEQDILNGYKILRGNYKLYLDVALSQGSIVKLDTIAYLDGRYVEVTNFFLISKIDKFGNRQILSEELGDYEQSLLSDVHKYYSSNPLKSIKRLWMYLAFKRRLCDLTKFETLFSSNIALYSQILADIEVAILLLRSNLNYDPKLLFDSMNSRLKLLNGLCVNEPLYHDVRSSNFITISNNLEILHNCLLKQINIATIQWLSDNNIDINSLINNH